jgi:ribulose-phosphate 3-epimerase
MSVNPGFGGQAFIPSSLDKVRQLAAWQRERGSGLFIQGRPLSETVAEMRRAVE